MRNRSQYATVGVIDAATLAMDIKEVRALATTRQPSKHCPVMLPREEHLSETHWYRFAQKFAYYRTGVAYHRWYRKNYRDIVDFTATADDCTGDMRTSVLMVQGNLPALWRRCEQVCLWRRGCQIRATSFYP